jgi:uncharacterized membrane protein YkvA (DUF1232 family)
MNHKNQGSSQSKPVSLGFLADLIRQARLAWRLWRDPRVSLWLKAIIPASVCYVFLPLDFLPDLFLGLGQVDDLAVMIFGVMLFIELCPPEIVREHMQNLMDEMNWQVEPDSASSSVQVVDAPYQVKKD